MSLEVFNLIIGISALAIYCIGCYIAFGMTKSISATFYKFPEELRFLYTLFMWWLALPTMIAGSNILIFLAGSGIALTGTAADVRRSELTAKLHSGGVVVGIMLGLLSVWIDFNNLFLALGGAIICGLLYYYKVRNHTYYIEVAAYLTVWLGILLWQ